MKHTGLAFEHNPPGSVPSPSSMSAPALSVHAAERPPIHALRLAPGIALATLVGIASLLIAAGETRAFGHPVIEGLVVAILLGIAIRTLWVPPLWIDAGVRFTATRVLEAAVFLLGASVDLPLLVRAGPALALGIVLLVVLGISCSYGIGRALGLPHKLAVLVACGNSICGNSAIAAIAPVIHADKEHVASSIAFTAILGVVVVIGLPFLIHPLGLSLYQYGVLAGLTVYAVPQVLAAAFPVSVLSGQVGTLVKLVRVLMLGPVVLFFAITHRNDPAARGTRVPGFQLTRFVPWFIIGFMVLAICRSSGAIPSAGANAMKNASMWLTVASMAALGLGVDLKAITKVGRPVIITVTASLLVLIVLGVTLIRLLAIR